MKDKEKQIEEIFDILNKFEFFQGQRAGRELWLDKPKEVQDKDIADFVRDINYIRSYLKDSVVLSREELSEIIKQTKETEKNYYKKVVIPKERKETAEKILEHILRFANEKGIVEIPIANIKSLAVLYGVEIKE